MKGQRYEGMPLSDYMDTLAPRGDVPRETTVDELDCEHGIFFVFCERCAPCEAHDTHGCSDPACQRVR